MLDRLLLLGASGDLARRYLLPALAALHAAGRLPASLEVTAAARQDWDDATFRELASQSLAEHAPGTPAASRDAILRSLRYRPADAADAGDVAALTAAVGGPVAAYLALPPAAFRPAAAALLAAGLPPGSRIVLEKPFGTDLDDTRELNRLLEAALGDTADEVVFRVDHALGMATVQNLIGLRLGTPALDAIWRAQHVERVDVLWEETVALEGRAGYYDAAGALEDVVQNHVLQVLALLALEPPEGAAASGGVRASKLDVLRAVEVPQGADVATRARRARYAAGTLAPPPEGSGRRVPAYADEEGVDPQRDTETFAEVVVGVGTDRWAGTPFVLRAGKALARRRKLARLCFRGTPNGAPSELVIGLDGPTDVTFAVAAGSPDAPAPLVLRGDPSSDGLPPYSRVLLDVLAGGRALSVQADEAELGWRIISPVAAAWAAGIAPLEEYAAGSDGPAPLDLDAL